MSKASLPVFIVLALDYSDPQKVSHDTFSVQCDPNELHLCIYDRYDIKNTKQREANSIQELIQFWDNPDTIVEKSSNIPNIKLEIYDSKGNHLFQVSKELLTSKYLIVNENEETVKILPGEFMLQVSRVFNDYRNVSQIRNIQELEEACATVCNHLGWRIIRIADEMQTWVTPTK